MKQKDSELTSVLLYIFLANGKRVPSFDLRRGYICIEFSYVSIPKVSFIIHIHSKN